MLSKEVSNIRKELKEFIKETGLSVAEFAESIGYSDTYVFMILNKNRNPSYNFQQRLKEKYPEADSNKLFFKE